MIFKVSIWIFFAYILIHLLTEVWLVSYIARIFYICIHVCKRYYVPLLLFLRWKAKKKKFQFLDYICYVLALYFRCGQSKDFLLLKNSVSVGFFKITAFPIFFSNAKRIQISMESVMIELSYI